MVLFSPNSNTFPANFDKRSPSVSDHSSKPPSISELYPAKSSLSSSSLPSSSATFPSPSLSPPLLPSSTTSLSSSSPPPSSLESSLLAASAPYSIFRIQLCPSSLVIHHQPSAAHLDYSVSFSKIHP